MARLLEALTPVINDMTDSVVATEFGVFITVHVTEAVHTNWCSRINAEFVAIPGVSVTEMVQTNRTPAKYSFI